MSGENPIEIGSVWHPVGRHADERDWDVLIKAVRIGTHYRGRRRHLMVSYQELYQPWAGGQSVSTTDVDDFLSRYVPTGRVIRPGGRQQEQPRSERCHHCEYVERERRAMATHEFGYNGA